jgi:Flp pilus assembly pilin Flp
MWRLLNILKRNRKGQNLIEYAMVAAIVASAVVAMSTYVFRSVQATQQAIQEEFLD